MRSIGSIGSIGDNLQVGEEMKVAEASIEAVFYPPRCYPPRCNSCCNVSTKRFWEKRLREQLHVSALTGKPLSGVEEFAPMQHIKSGSCPVNAYSRDNFSIIGREQNPYLLKMKESIFISTTKPDLNNNIVSVPLYLFKP